MADRNRRLESAAEDPVIAATSPANPPTIAAIVTRVEMERALKRAVTMCQPFNEAAAAQALAPHTSAKARISSVHPGT